jgi:hypothetical protein
MGGRERGIFMTIFTRLFRFLRGSDGWEPLGNFYDGVCCPFCRAGPEQNGFNFVIIGVRGGDPASAYALMTQMPHARTPKVAVCKKCKGRYEWKWAPRGEGKQLFSFVWRPAAPAPSPIPANATPDERADWELWLRACDEGTVEAYAAYLRDSRLRLFAAEANTLLRSSNPVVKPPEAT